MKIGYMSGVGVQFSFREGLREAGVKDGLVVRVVQQVSGRFFLEVRGFLFGRAWICVGVGFFVGENLQFLLNCVNLGRYLIFTIDF